MDHFDYHFEEQVRELDTAAITNDDATLAIVTCDMGLGVVLNQQIAQTMVMQITAIQEASARAWPLNGHTLRSNTMANSSVSSAAPDNDSTGDTVEQPASKKIRTVTGPVLLFNACAQRCRRSSRASRNLEESKAADSIESTV